MVYRDGDILRNACRTRRPTAVRQSSLPGNTSKSPIKIRFRQTVGSTVSNLLRKYDHW